MKASQERTRLGLTDAGKTVLRGTCFVALAALIVPTFGVLSALVSVMLVSLRPHHYGSNGEASLRAQERRARACI
jgi:hypothetical protein